MSNANSPSTAWSRLRDRYFGLAVSTRMICVAAVAVFVIIFGYWAIVPAPVQSTYLLGGQEFNARQIQAISRALESEGITGFCVDGARVKVPREQLPQCAAAIAKHDVLPAGSYGPLDRAAEQTSFWTTSAQDDRRWDLGRQKMLAQMIEGMPDVETATVLVDRTTPRGLRSQSDVRATVTIKPRSGRELPPLQIRQIRSMMAGAVAGLQPESVAVVDLNGRALIELGASDNTSDDLLMHMKQFEDHFTFKIRSVLSYLPDVMVTASVELDTTRQRRTEQVVIAPDSEPDGDAREHDAHLPPAVSANAAVDLEPVEEPRSQVDPRATQQQTWEEHVPLAPKSVTVAVEVPQDVVAALATTQSAAAVDAWKIPIRDRVASAIPAGISANVHIASYPRKMERSPATPAGAATFMHRDWIAWGVTGVAITLTFSLTLGGVRWHQSRKMKRHAGASPIASDRSSHFDHAASDDTGDRPRDLVRIDRTPRTRGRGPHLIQATISGFEDLRRLAPSSLQAVLGAVDSRLWAPALRGASRELSERILTHMPARAAVLLRHEIEFPGPIRLGDVETAQQEILEVVRRLDHTGDLMLEDREELCHE